MVAISGATLLRRGHRYSMSDFYVLLRQQRDWPSWAHGTLNLEGDNSVLQETARFLERRGYLVEIGEGWVATSPGQRIWIETMVGSTKEPLINALRRKARWFPCGVVFGWLPVVRQFLGNVVDTLHTRIAVRFVRGNSGNPLGKVEYWIASVTTEGENIVDDPPPFVWNDLQHITNVIGLNPRY